MKHPIFGELPKLNAENIKIVLKIKEAKKALGMNFNETLKAANLPALTSAQMNLARFAFYS